MGSAAGLGDTAQSTRSRDLGPDRIGSHPADAALVSLLPLEHLPRCPHHRSRSSRHRRAPVDGPGCDWCAWSWITATTRTLASLERDAGVLAKLDDAGVLGAVAWRRLTDLRQEATTALNHPESDVPPDLGRRLVDRADRALERTSTSWVDRATRTTRRAVLETAAALAAAACSPPGERHRLDLLPPALAAEVGRALDAVPDRLSSTTQVATMLPVIDRRLHRELPPLWSQPEWQRREGLDFDQLRAARVAPGSLESLVLERIIDELTEQLLEVGAELCTDTVEVPVRPSLHHPSGSARHLIWRINRIDWHATWVDATETSDVAAVPWYLAVAIDLAIEHGRVSLLASPEMEGR